MVIFLLHVVTCLSSKVKLQKGPFDGFVLKLRGLQVKQIKFYKLSNIKAGTIHFFFQITLRICLLLAFSSVTHRFCLIPLPFQLTLNCEVMSSVLVHSFLTSSLFRCIAFNFTYILIVSFESTQLM